MKKHMGYLFTAAALAFMTACSSPANESPAETAPEAENSAAADTNTAAAEAEVETEADTVQTEAVTADEYMQYYCFADESSGKIGYKNAAGEVVIEPQFDYAENFSENGIAQALQTDHGYKQLYIDVNGNTVLEYTDSARRDSFASNGLMLAFESSGGDMGFVDIKGNFVIKPQFSTGAGFADNGLAAVRNENEKWGYIDKTGKYVISPVYLSALPFAPCGLAAVQTENGWEYINETGETVIDSSVAGQQARSFADNGIAICGGGFINTKGETLFDSKYKTDWGSDFGSNGLAYVYYYENGLYNSGYINEQGEMVIGPKTESEWTTAGPFADNGLAVVENGKGKRGYIDESGDFVLEPQYDSAGSFDENGLASVKIDGEKFIIDRDGNRIEDRR